MSNNFRITKRCTSYDILWFTFHCDNISSLAPGARISCKPTKSVTRVDVHDAADANANTFFFGSDFMFTPRGTTSTPLKWNKLSVSLHRTNKWYAKVISILLSNYSIYMPAGSGARRHSHLPLSGYRFFFSSTRISFSLHHALPLTLEWKEEKTTQTNLNKVTSRTRNGWRKKKTTRPENKHSKRGKPRHWIKTCVSAVILS